ncbi:MAG: Gfo/Idh/MocA family oxidoreductase [Acidobacteriota bacterium]
MTRSMTRRDALSASLGLFGTALAPAVVARARAAQPRASAADRVRLGVIGCNGMGFSDLSACLKVKGVECTALCDVDQSVLDRRSREVEEMTDRRPALHSDYRALLDRSDVDAVILGTPDHWHCLQMIDACQAGKHVYVEKSMAHSVEESELMVRAAEHYGRVVQVGQWQRSGTHWADAVEFVQSGKLGRIRQVKTWAFMDRTSGVTPVADSPAPAGVDYDAWLGPRPQRPFNRNRFHFDFRWYWDYAGGLMTDWGVHLLDIALWAMKAESPRRVVSLGGAHAYPGSAIETPDTQQAIYEYDGFSLVWEHAMGIGLGPFQRAHGVAFVGNNGTLVVDRGKWEIYPEVRKVDRKPSGHRMKSVPVQEAKPSARGLLQHTANFIDGIRTGAKQACDPKTASLAAVNAQLGNLAFRSGQSVVWDGDKGECVGNDVANALLKLDYRKPWSLPTF